MTWVIPVAIGAAQIQQQNVIGKTNQAIQNRNAQVAKQEGDAIEQQAEFDVATFAKKFKKLQAEQKVATIKSGAELFSAILGLASITFYFNLLAGILSLSSLLLYTFVYTPLKKVGPIAVFVGAIPGALPPLGG